MSYIQEKAWEAVNVLVTAIHIKRGLGEALKLLSYGHLHAKTLPIELQNELAEILREGSKRNDGSGTGSLEFTLRGMRMKTAQALAARIFDFFLDVRDLPPRADNQ